MMRLSAVPALITLLLVTSNVEAQQPGRGRGRGPFGGRGMPEGITFLVAVPEIQKELGLSSDQQELLDDLQADLRDQRRGLYSRGFGSPRGRDERFEELRKKIQEFNRHGDQLVKTVLEPKQAERLDQLELQRAGIRVRRRAPESIP